MRRLSPSSLYAAFGKAAEETAQHTRQKELTHTPERRVVVVLQKKSVTQGVEQVIARPVGDHAQDVFIRGVEKPGAGIGAEDIARRCREDEETELPVAPQGIEKQPLRVERPGRAGKITEQHEEKGNREFPGQPAQQQACRHTLPQQQGVRLEHGQKMRGHDDKYRKEPAGVDPGLSFMHRHSFAAAGMLFGAVSLP